jgi:soluble lytic murein transglycosylase-like protein
VSRSSGLAVKAALALAVVALIGKYTDDTHAATLHAHAESVLAVAPGATSIPPEYLALYQRWGTVCPHVDWALLAGIGKTETNHGRSNLPGVHSGANYAGAEGPMQFLPSTFRAVRHRHPQVGPDLYDPADAIPAAAYLLCDNGGGTNLDQAVYSYNHSWSYVHHVESAAAAYRRAS